MNLIPIESLTDEQWAGAHATTYDKTLAQHMGTTDEFVSNPPTLEQFYVNIMNAVEAGRFKAWSLVDDDGNYQGHTLLDKSSGEWESGTIIKDNRLWKRGYGVKATLHAFQWAFEEDGADWVIAFTNGKDQSVIEMHEKAGYKRFMHFWIFSRETWEARWADRMRRMKWA